MISPHDFLGKWNIETYGLVNYEESNINSFSLTNETKDFLIKAGGVRLTEINNGLGKMYDRFIYLGYTSNGYPVCIDESESEVVYIDYDNENNSILINSTIAKFAESLITFVEFIKKVKDVNGRRAYIKKMQLKNC